MFWMKVADLISKITKISVNLTPALALLNIDMEEFPPMYQCLIIHILLAARLTIVI